MTKDKIFSWKFFLCCGLFLWFIINLLQGLFTEIQEDEAYYALYGEHLAWGYFDHPPMVGLMTFLSSILFSGSLGVRFFTIIASCLSLWVMWLIANKTAFNYIECYTFRQAQRPASTKAPEPVEGPTSRKVLLFFTLAFSVVMFNIYGFVTTPDAGLILFSALFLFIYQRYVSDNSWKNALLMGLLMACMIYSKYHAFLLLGLIVLSNLKLLKDGKFYVACLVALVLLAPHILWQIDNGFPSFRYHLAGRCESFRWSYFLEYLPNQLLIFNPFTFGAVVYVLMTCKATSNVITSEVKQSRERTPQEVFEQGLWFILIGFFVFFWLMTFRGHVEPHWTIVCIIPVVVLLYRRALDDAKLGNYVKYCILPSLAFVLALRVLLPTSLTDRFGYHGKEPYYHAIESIADDRPVVFRGSFQQPALYHYFTGKESSTLQSYYDRMTQYDLWQFDTAWIGQPVFVCGTVLNRSEVFEIGCQRVEGYLMSHFQSPNRLVIDFSLVFPREGNMLHYGDTLQVDFSLYNPLSEPIDFQSEEMNMSLVSQYLFTNSFCYCFYDEKILIKPHSYYTGHLYTIVCDDIPTGKNRFTIGVGDGVSSFITEGNFVEVTVRE